MTTKTPKTLRDGKSRFIKSEEDGRKGTKNNLSLLHHFSIGNTCKEGQKLKHGRTDFD